MQVYYRKNFLNATSCNFEWRILGEFYADTFSDCPSDKYTSVSEDDSSSQYSSDSEDVTIRPKKKKKRHKMLVIDSDTESENEIHSAGEDHTGASGVTVECNNLQNDNEITELVFGWPK